MIIEIVFKDKKKRKVKEILSYTVDDTTLKLFIKDKKPETYRLSQIKEYSRIDDEKILLFG